MANRPKNKLLDAAQFVQFGQDPKRAKWCVIKYGRIVAQDEQLCASAPVLETDLNCVLPTAAFVNALKNCSGKQTITQAGSFLTVSDENFIAHIDTFGSEQLALYVPDEPQRPLGEAFVSALKVVAPLTKEAAKTVLQASISIYPYFVAATDGYVVAEVGHGTVFQKRMVVPRRFADAIVKCGHIPTSYGCSDDSLTIHFNEGRWIRTALYKEDVPNIDEVFPKFNKSTIQELVKNSLSPLFELASLDVQREFVFSKIDSSNSVQLVNVFNLSEGFGYRGCDLKYVSKYSKRVDISNRNKTVFYGDNCRFLIGCSGKRADDEG